MGVGKFTFSPKLSDRLADNCNYRITSLLKRNIISLSVIDSSIANLIFVQKSNISPHSLEVRSREG